jgi:hypothetical protein
MIPVRFPECNTNFRHPDNLEESQCATIPAHIGEIQGGSCDGLKQVVVAYQLTKEEINVLANGGLLYFSMIGGLAPHYPSLSFHAATHPA